MIPSSQRRAFSLVFLGLCFVGSVLDAATDLCCRRQAYCVCAFQEATGDDLNHRRFAPGAVELIRIRGPPAPSPTLFALRYKPKPKKAAVYTVEPTQEHLVQELTLDIDLLSFHPENAERYETVEPRQSMSIPKLERFAQLGRLLPRLSINRDYLVVPVVPEFLLPQGEGNAEADSTGTLPETRYGEIKTGNPDFIKFNQTFAWPREAKRELPARWIRQTSLRFRLNETAILSQPVLMALRWNSKWEEDFDESETRSKLVLPALVNVSLLRAAWGPKKETATLGEALSRTQHWQKANLQVIADSELILAMQQYEEDEKSGIGFWERLWRRVQKLWTKANNYLSTEGKVTGLLVVGATVLKIWGPRPRLAIKLFRWFKKKRRAAPITAESGTVAAGAPSADGVGQPKEPADGTRDSASSRDSIGSSAVSESRAVPNVVLLNPVVGSAPSNFNAFANLDAVDGAATLPHTSAAAAGAANAFGDAGSLPGPRPGSVPRPPLQATGEMEGFAVRGGPSAAKPFAF
jgi:hypothetical protein